MGGAIDAIDYMKSRLVDSNADRLNKIERNETIVVGVNKWQQGEQSPLQTEDGGIMVVDPAVEDEQIARLNDWKANRDAQAVQTALSDLREASSEGRKRNACLHPSCESWRHHWRMGRRNAQSPR